MKTKTMLIAAVLLLSVFLIGCSQSPSGNYATYNQQQQGQQNQYVGGGCGVAPSADYQQPVKVEDSAM